ncbi:hypothetical protein VCHA34P126_130131 [Vibrio chagasii]|nr:hypothetical protein VCHA34P126_130131 [Vibrio chagasii]
MSIHPLNALINRARAINPLSATCKIKVISNDKTIILCVDLNYQLLIEFQIHHE